MRAKLTPCDVIDHRIRLKRAGARRRSMPLATLLIIIEVAAGIAAAPGGLWKVRGYGREPLKDASK
jgi:hypothetical protein